MKKICICVLISVIASYISAQTDYQNLLVRYNRTFWATAVSLYDYKVESNITQAGMCLHQDGKFEWYNITNENDTSWTSCCLDTEIFVSHRTYDLHQDTLFITSWQIGLDENGNRKSRISEAFKILYITEQNLFLLLLSTDEMGNWVEHTYPPHDRLTVVEYRLMR